MLHNKTGFFTKSILAALFGVLVSVDVFAGSSNSVNINSRFSLPKNSTLTWGVGDYLLAGCSDPDKFTSACHGTYSDEGAIVVNMARTFNDRGGYFCPTQIQFGNENKEQKIWVNFNKPADGAAGCKWICQDGYKGENCEESDDGNVRDDASMTALKKGSLRTSGGDDQRVSGTVDVFARSEHSSSSSDRGAKTQVLAILRYMDHGVLVGKLWVYGTRDWGGTNWLGSNNGSDIKSWVTKVQGQADNAGEVLLCADGYRALNDQCVPILDYPILPDMCPGWSEEGYKAHESDFIYKEIKIENSKCRQYRCAERGKAFPAEDNRVCEICVRGGADKTNGVCKKCDIGQVFDEDIGACKNALGLSKKDLQYGKNQTNTKNVKAQCWTKTDPDAYKCCVRNDPVACAAAKEKNLE